ncbi:MarR family transcriptional regulator [Staphylococcus sp. SQ8-PEA]|uniref:MarR family transcriptional regulator n=1 Tax=Staphylococcus marylandisciuri TaxID=2981529 RepID=A0ABT2QSA1_9STAP|nr:MarR family transcriptional regulator [Staphylococcus marylandisciuri]MCU5746864.1 MarR family transcriptional regulator [Staphylococcus marylandisciuri]
MLQGQKLMRDLRVVFNKLAWLNKQEMEEQLKGYSPSEVHCLEAIKDVNNPNVRKLSQRLFMTRGAVSKLTKKLLHKQLIERYRDPNNKKEIYYTLTEAGERVEAIHSQLHEKYQARDLKVFEEMSEAELEAIFRFIERYNAHLDTEIKKEGVET